MPARDASLSVRSNATAFALLPSSQPRLVTRAIGVRVRVHADEAKVPSQWSETQNVKWKTPIPGLGWSSPVILDKQIWLTTATEDGKSLRAVCVDPETGKIIHDVEVFRVEALQPKNSLNSYASPTPVLETGRVYVSFGTYGNACLDTATGQPIWKNTDLKLDHMEGPGASPILWGDYYVLHCDGRDVQYLAELDKKSGAVVRKVQRSYPMNTLRPDQRKAFDIPTVVNIGGKDQLISVAGFCAYGYDPADGRELWHLGLTGWSNVPRPVYRDGIAYISTGYMEAELWAVKIDATGPGGTPPVLWKWKHGAPLKPSILLIGDSIYFISDAGVARCLDSKTGEQRWQGRLLSACSASPIYANGLIYFFDEQGRSAVIRPGNTLDKVGENQLDGKIMASPAVLGNALFLRTDQALYRIEN